jgi:type II secretory pathway component GspD/PulD (secretin)
VKKCTYPKWDFRPYRYLLAGLLYFCASGLLTSARAENPPAPPAEPEITVTCEGVSVHAVGVYSHVLFTRLAEKTGLQVIVDDTIKSRRITVNLDKLPVAKIIENIVSTYGFSSGEVNGVIMISEGIPRKPSSYLLSDIAAIPTQYVPATEAKNLLPVFLQDYVKVNTEQNAVILSAPRDVLTKFREDIGQFDIPAAQIMLEVLVVEFSENSSDELDLNFSWRDNARGLNAAASVGEIALQGITHLTNEFQMHLQALIQQGRAEVRAAPRVATVSGSTASIFVGLRRYVRTPIDDPTYGSINYIDAGVQLSMTPWTGGGGDIITDIHPDISTLSALDPITGLPERSTRQANTLVRLKAGETAVIGGLTQTERRETRTKVPLLGDIPLLGNLFRSRNIQANKTNLYIFVTPKLLSQTGHLSPEEEAQLKRRFLPEENPAPPAVAPAGK